MALEFKQSLRQVQTPTITLQLQQAIKLLQLSQMELAGVVQKELVENPVLELAEPDSTVQEPRTEAAAEAPAAEAGKAELDAPPSVDDAPSTNDIDDIDWAAYLADRSERTRSYGTGEARSEDLPSYDQVLTRAETLTEHLEWQLAMSDLNQVERWAAEQIIGNLDEAGYLQAPLEELADEEIPLEAYERAHPAILQMDPLGVGARDLRECLLTQSLSLFPDERDLHLLLDEHLDLLMKRKDPSTFARAAGISPERARSAMALVKQLEPKPGRSFGGENPRYITPDVYVIKVGDEYEIQLNDDGLPRLKVSNYYKDVLGDMKNKDRDYVRERLRSATWLIRSIYQRRQTIYKVMRSIVKQQRPFFDEGVERLKPLVLREVAEDIGMHESTVSRVTSNKYVHCSQGIFPLKFFFNSGLSTDGGADMASEAVKSRLKQLLDDEDPRNPLSDQTLVELLGKEGIQVARRTVAKYRTAMGYLPSSKRKQLY